MGLAAIKAQSRQMTSPSALLTAANATPYVRSSLQAFAKNDPVQEELDMDITPDIRAKDVLRLRAHKIVKKYESETEEQKEQEREHNGGLTNFELYQLMVLETNRITLKSINTEFQIKIVAPPDFTIGNSVVGRDGKSYVAILDQEGKTAYFDTGESCVMNKGGLSPTTPAKVNDDLIDKDQAYNITYKVDAQGNETRRTAEDADFQLALTRMDNQHTKLPYQLDMIDRIEAEVTGSTSFKSAAPVEIKTDKKPADPFTTAAIDDTTPAASKSIMFKAREPLPWEKQPTPTKANTFEPTL